MKKIEKSIIKEISLKNKTPIKLVAALSNKYDADQLGIALRELVRSGKVHVDMNWKLSLSKTR